MRKFRYKISHVIEKLHFVKWGIFEPRVIQGWPKKVSNYQES